VLENTHDVLVWQVDGPQVMGLQFSNNVLKIKPILICIYTFLWSFYKHTNLSALEVKKS